MAPPLTAPQRNASGQANTTTTILGSGTFLRGRVGGSGDVEIAGHIQGEIECSGEVLVEAGGLVAGNVDARRIIVRGAVKGDLTAEEAIVLENGARVVGDLRAPRVTIAQGGLARGYVQTAAAVARRAEVSRSAAPPAVRPAALGASSSPSKVVPMIRVEPKKVESHGQNGQNATRTVSTEATRPSVPAPSSPPRAAVAPGASAPSRMPPPPVVTALKKGTKAVVHQKKR